MKSIFKFDVLSILGLRNKKSSSFFEMWQKGDCKEPYLEAEHANYSF